MVDDLEAASQNKATSRRSVLGGLAGGLGIVLIGPARQATAAGAAVAVTAPPGGLTIVATSARTVVRVPTLLGATLKVSSQPVRTGSTVSVAFDDRLYRSAPPSLTTVTGQVVRCRRTQTIRQRGSDTKITTITLDEALVPGNTYTLSLGTRRLIRYPDDVVAAPLPIQISVADKVAGKSGRKLLDSVEAEHSVWGLKVGAGWQPVYWGDSFHSWTPELVTVASTGPAEVPAGTVISASLDARLFSSARFESLGGRTSSGADGTRIDDVLRVLWVLPKPLAAKSRTSIRLMVNVANLNAPLPGLHPPTVTARAADAAVGQRITGCESTTREDSAYDALTQLTYGLDLLTPLRPR
jgi:hypothetical protein